MMCHPTCHGLDIFESGRGSPPAGFVEIERCDECAVYLYDETAAIKVAGLEMALWYDPYSGETHQIPVEATEFGNEELLDADSAWCSHILDNNGERQPMCIVPIQDATAFGLTVETEQDHS